MFDFVRLPNPIERLEFDWVRLVFCSVLFDWIGRADYTCKLHVQDFATGKNFSFDQCSKQESFAFFLTVMQTLDFVSGLHDCLEFSQPLEFLYQAIQTWKTFSIA